MIPQSAEARTVLLEQLRDVDLFARPLYDEVAERCGVSRATVCRVYQGKFTQRRKSRAVRRALNAEIAKRLRKLQRATSSSPFTVFPPATGPAATGLANSGPAADAVAAMFPPKLSPLTRHLLAGPVESQHKARG